MYTAIVKLYTLPYTVRASSEYKYFIFFIIRKGADLDRLYEITSIKKYFLEQMKELVDEEEALLKFKGRVPDDEALTQAKKDGFSDKYLGISSSVSPLASIAEISAIGKPVALPSMKLFQ